MSDTVPADDFDEDTPAKNTGTTEFVDAPSDDFDDVEGVGV